MVRRLLCVFALMLLVGEAVAQAEFPYDLDLILDARPMRGGKRIPILTIERSGRAQLDLWCKRGQGQVTIEGDAITVTPLAMRDEACTPERAQADEEILTTLLQVTTWQMRGNIVTLTGGASLRFKAATN
jgi:heat shock protein HslJ